MLRLGIVLAPIAVFVAIFALSGALFPATAAEGGSAVYVELEDAGDGAAKERWKLYGASQALVIGIDDYDNGWPRLSNAVADAEAVAAELEARGFEVTKLIDPTGEKLRSELRNFFAFKGADPDARLFVWFAGHGYTEFGEGYLVPADAPDPSEPAFRAVALHMGDVGSMVRIARSKHVFAVFDSCFAGTIFNSSRARPPAAITRAVTEPVRQFLTSGDANQQVSDDGTFRRLFLRALDGNEDADANGDGYLTGTELSLHLEDRVVNLTDSLQTPRSGKLRDPRFDQGDFVFLLPETRGLEVAAAQPEAEAEAGSRALPRMDPELAVEMEFWDSIKNSKQALDYQAYLDTFPEGRFVRLAEARIVELSGREVEHEAELARLRAEEQEHRQHEAEQAAQLAALQSQQVPPAEQEEIALGLNRADRRELQAALTALGFDTQGIDGFFGPATRGAIEDYQAAKGAERTGFLTAALARSLLAEAPAAAPAQPATTQSAARPSQAAITEQDAAAYLRKNATALKHDLMDYNQDHRVIHGSYGGAAERLDILSWKVEAISGDEVTVAVAWREPVVVLAGKSGTDRFLLRWTGSDLVFVGHEAGGTMRRTGG